MHDVLTDDVPTLIDVCYVITYVYEIIKFYSFFLSSASRHLLWTICRAIT